ncbi:DUF3515 domain-containing protein [Nocardia sp. XZ_19_385]|uniref:DUF3515 domain-containing protein n=1 Tax=Nocardia sp. XZ_19_385 TaxID=2769488 RepID=UPI00188E5FFB|nr:DUF3515 domain-containing protein [Nocardia sp. XZ_19_385]
MAAQEPDSDSEPRIDKTANEAESAPGLSKPENSPAEEPRAHSYPPALVASAVALPIMLVVGVLVAAVMASRGPVERDPLVLGPVPAPAAEGPACTALLPTLPSTLGDYTHSQLVDPQPPGTRAWQLPEGGNPIVLRCGLDRPLDFNRASGLQIVNGVQWFEARDQTAKTSTWFAVDRETYVALTVPDGSGPTPLQEVSDTIKKAMPEKPIDPGPIPN